MSNTLKLTAICGLLLSVVARCLAEDCVLHIYSVCTDEVKFKKEVPDGLVNLMPSMVNDDKYCDSSVDMGSAWYVSVDGTNMLITAKHVFGLDSCINVEEIRMLQPIITSNCPKCRVFNVYEVIRTSKVIVGGLAYKPKYIAIPVIDGAPSDVAVLYMESNQVYDVIKPIVLANRPPSAGERVELHGYPGTIQPQIQYAEVSSVQDLEGYCVLNTPVDGGYSGGVVLSSIDKRAYGVIVGNPNGKQATVLLVTDALLRSTKPQPADEVLSKTFTPCQQ